MSTKQRTKLVPAIKNIMTKWAPIIEHSWSGRGKMIREVKRYLASEGTTLEAFLASYKKLSDKNGQFTPQTRWVEPLFNGIW